MTANISLFIIQISFGVAVLAHLILVALLPKTRTSKTGKFLVLAVCTEILWALINLTLTVDQSLVQGMLFGAELLRFTCWALFLQSLLSQARVNRSGHTSDSTESIQRELLVMVGAFLIGYALSSLDAPNRYLILCTLLLSVGVLVLLEQVWRRTTPNRRWGLKFLGIALLLKFGLDIVVYSEALLFDQLDTGMWAIRGLANAIIVPLLAVAAARNPAWRLEIGVSRSAVFYSASLTIIGGFLIAVALGGYYLRLFGGNWASVGSSMFIFVAISTLLVLSSSGTARAKLRVLIEKNFFSYRYDYRAEWLRLAERMESLDEESDSPEIDTLAVRAIDSLGALVESTGGAAWIRESNAQFRCIAVVNRSEVLPVIEPGASIIQFFEETGSIVDLRPGAINHRDWSPEMTPAALQAEAEAVFIVPLNRGGQIVGLILLDRLRIDFPMNWEVYEMLKIAARQISSYLAVRQSTEALILAEEFDTFNRMSAFVVHDLKNQVSQLSMILSGADRHGDDPEYQRDVLETVREVFQQMQALLLQLKMGVDAKEQKPEQVDLLPLVEDIVNQRQYGGRSAHIDASTELVDTRVSANRGQLERAIGNLVQNAMDATQDQGSVQVKVTAGDQPNSVRIEVVDSGVGMSERFIRTRLFKPFTSTKPQGMGIGAFETQEYIRQLGGTLAIESQVGKGSRFWFELPIVEQYG